MWISISAWSQSITPSQKKFPNTLRLDLNSFLISFSVAITIKLTCSFYPIQKKNTREKRMYIEN